MGWDKIDREITASVIIQDGRGEIPLGIAHIEITGDRVLGTKKIILKKLKLIAEEGEVIYERS